MKNGIEGVSDTALWVATFRAQESERPDALFHDPLARKLSGLRGQKIADQMGNKKIMSWVMSVRTIAIDRMILQAISEGVDTVVNLGAGLDTRPYRLEVPANLRWIEIDFPHMIDLKNRELQNEKPKCHLERIAVDLSDRSKAQEVYRRIGSESKKILFITEGVLHYLPNEKVIDLSEDLLSLPSLEYWIQDFRGSLHRTPKGWGNKMQNSPFLFVPGDWKEFFESRGWKVSQTVYAVEEGERIGRPFPFIFPWSLLGFLMPKEQKKMFRKASGYFLFKRASSKPRA